MQKKELNNTSHWLITGIFGFIVLLSQVIPESIIIFTNDPTKENVDKLGELWKILWTAFLISLGAFFVVELIMHIWRHDKQMSKIEKTHFALNKFMRSYDNIMSTEIANQMLAVFEGFCKIYTEIGDKQKNFVVFLFKQKYIHLLNSVYKIPEDLNKTVYDVPGFYFESRENEDTESVWEHLIENTKKYRSFQLLTKEMQEVYNPERLNREIKFIKGKISAGEIRIFKKLLVLDYDMFKDCNIISRNKTIDCECLEKCLSKDMCKNKNIIESLRQWYTLLNEIKSFDVQIECDFKDNVDGLFDSCKATDFGIFDDILGIQNKVDTRNSPINDGFRCDFYFDSKKIDDYTKIFDNALNSETCSNWS